MTVGAPARAFGAFKPSASPGLLAASAAIAASFTATPFVIAEAADQFDVSIGLAAVLSTAQVGGFTVANLIGNRRFRASAGLAKRAIAAFTFANAVSIVAPDITALIAARAASGVAMGLLTWIAWADSATDGKRRGEIAAVGPLAAAIAAPLLGIVATVGDLRAIFALLTIATASSLALPISVAEGEIAPTRQPIQAPGVRIVLASLFLMTAAASAVFVFVRVIAENLALSSMATSLALSLNAIAGIPAARFAGRRRLPGLWLVIIGLCALLLTQTASTVVFFAVVTLWGLAFWSAVPEVFSMLAERSVYPSDRVGDAQATMSFGRVVGPTVGGVLVSGGSFTTIGLIAFGAILASAVAIEVVATAHRWR